MPSLYPNQFSLDYDREVREAGDAGAQVVEAPSDEFDRLAQRGDRLIYVISSQGVLSVCEPVVVLTHIRHSVLARGFPVVAAGEVELVYYEGYRYVIELNNLSGHYQPDAGCLQAAAAVFASLGFTVPEGAINSYNGG